MSKGVRPMSAPLDEDDVAAAQLARTENPGTFWIFGYGSLMWNPGFPYEERRHAVLAGFHRRFCIRSTIYRGTPEQPGLVLGIDNGGECHGMAFRVFGSAHRQGLYYTFWGPSAPLVSCPT